MDGKVAIVTGAAQGIGREYARALADWGAAVAVADLNLVGAKETATAIGEAGGKAVAVEVDVSDEASTRRLAEQVEAELGRIDVLVNNAAIYHSMRMDSALEVDIAYWRKVFSVNLDGALLCTRAVLPAMQRAGGGRIVNQTSTAAYLPGADHYTVSKLALVGLTQGLSRELGQFGITVNAIAPGVVYTDATVATVPADMLAGLDEVTAIPKRAMPSDLLSALRFLVSDDSGWVTGQTIVVDGGMVARL